MIGAGRMGRLHAELLRWGMPRARLVGVADTVPERAAALAGRLEVEPLTPAWALASPEVDLVAICAPSDSHPDLVVAAAEAGKAIFCEKPLALDLEELDRTLVAAESFGVDLTVGFNRRFDPAHRAARDAVRRGEVGEPHLVRLSSRDPAPPPPGYAASSGGMFLDMTIHDFDMARYLTGSEVVEVSALGAIRIDPDLEALGDVDTAVVTLRHANGCLTVIDNSRRAVYGYDQRLEVFGSAGMAASENPPSVPSVLWTERGARRPPLRASFLERYRPAYREQWRWLLEDPSRREPVGAGAADAREALVLGLAARRSLEEHRPVRIERPAGC
ncbi:MAG: inositol 2-dehydrogenase [Candidatus Dormibacteraceae bacterium]